MGDPAKSPVSSQRVTPGSPWWRNVNLKFIIISENAGDIYRGKVKDSNPDNATQHWLNYLSDRNSKNWYRAHNATIIQGYLDFVTDAGLESIYEQVFMNEVLYRLLFAQAMEEDATFLGDIGIVGANPELGSVNLITHIKAFYPDSYPLSKEDIQDVMHKSHTLDGDIVREFDEYLIGPHLTALFAEAAGWLNIPELTSFIRDNKPIYPNL